MELPEPAELSARQRRELEYHRQRAAEHQAMIDAPVRLDVVQSNTRRWWNAYWETYRLARAANLSDRRVLVLGCGFGEDAIRLASMGASVYAFDLSAESVEIARRRAEKMSLNIVFGTMPAEKTSYADQFFDAVWCLDILHHVDIPATVAELRRILKPGALIILDELYTHSALERVRRLPFVAKGLYPRMQRFIYGAGRPYITEDEHKIDEQEFAIITRNFRLANLRYFNFLVGRIISERVPFLSKLDRLLIGATGQFGRFLAGRVVAAGELRDAQETSSPPRSR